MSPATKEAPKKATNELAVLKESTVGAVEKRISQLTANHQLTLPENYSVGNALQAAWLALQEVKDKSGKLALESCSRNSVVQSLFSMCVQALDVGKKQGYFIPYGNQLTFQRSYFGTLAVAKRMADVLDAYVEIIYEDDTFEYEIDDGQKRVTKHGQSLGNVKLDKIQGAYAVIIFADERRSRQTEIMTMEQIQKAWAKGANGNPARKDFPDEMAKRTVLNRALKRHINSSSDDHLFVREFNRGDSEAAVGEIEVEASEHANRELVDFDDDRTIDMEADQAEAPASVGDEGLFPGEEDGPGY